MVPVQELKPITIVGGGLAGLTLGILLRREKIPVRTMEASGYPRHRVCGEFISGNGREVLRQLDFDQKLLVAGAREARTATFFWRGRKIALALPEPALCISRFELDALLATEFMALGGELQSHQRVPVQSAEGVVRATGRRRAETTNGHLFGLKAHAGRTTLSADLELHFSANRYVGICRLGNDNANVCGLFYSPTTLTNLQNEWPRLLRDAVSSPALANALWDADSFCSVAGLTLDRTMPDLDFAVGDATAMIPPLTGNGMSMAFESSALAARALCEYSAGRCSWTDALAQYRWKWKKSFASRLRWAGFVQRLVFHPTAQGALFLMAGAAPGLPKLLFARTR